MGAFQRIHARDIVAMTTQEVIAGFPDGENGRETKLEIEFDNGEVITTSNRKTMYTSYCWEFFRRYPEVQILPRHHFGQRRMSSTLHIDLMDESYWDIVDHYGGRINQEDMDRLAYEVTNDIYVDAILRIPEWVAHLDYDDYREVVRHPVIWNALLDLEPNRQSLRKCQETIKKALLTEKVLSRNPLVRFVRSGFISMSQLLQCIGPKGYQTDVDSNYFPHPVMSSFLHGLRSLYEMAIESRSATKALRYSKDQVEKGEYFNRKMQLGCAPIEHIFQGDCGTTKYMEVRMTPERLQVFAGKYRVMDDGMLRPIVPKLDKDLAAGDGQVIKIRSAIHCQHLHKQGICETCFGYMSKSIPMGTNLGIACASELCKDASQAILSVKHDDHTSEASDVMLGEFEKTFFEIALDGENELRMISPEAGSNYRLVVNGKFLPNLMDVMVAKDVTQLSLTNMSAIYDCEIWYTSEDGFEQVARLTVANGNRLASFTYEFLQYLVEAKWTPGGGDRYIFDLKDWDFTRNMFVLPVKHANMLEFIADLESFIRSTGGKDDVVARDRLINYNSLDEGVLAMTDLVLSKLRVNFAHLEVVACSMTARSQSDGRFPRMASEGVIMPYEELINIRSLGGALAYEHFERIFGVAGTYTRDHRMSHPMDAMVCR